MTILLKRAPRSDTLSVVMPEDRRAKVERAEYLMQHYRAPPHVAERVVQEMDRATATLLAIEMHDMQRASYAADYDPFEGI